MRRRRVRSVGKIASYEVYFSGDTEAEPSNETQGRNSITGNLSSRRSSKEFSKRNVVSKQSQTSETLKWLSENYELVQGVCVPRCVLYTHYLDFCKKRKFNPAGPATFGKLIRQRFPKLTTRRLGTRGQSKYHYYGISIKESSPYYHSLYSAKGLTRFSGTPAAKEGTTWKFCFDKRGGNSLPEFPRASEMILDQNLSIEKVETFIIMYRTHCQRLLDTIMNANFDEVHKFLLHFWQGMPEHMIPVLRCSAVVDIIAVCDSLLYKILNDVLVPSCIQDIPDSLTAEIKTFAITFVNSLQSCLANTPDILRHQKLRVARNFVRLLTRNMTFINLAQTARPVFLSYESMSGILAEFRRLDLKRILSELLFLTEKTNVDLPLLLLVIQEFENLLIKQAPIEAYAEWFDNIVDEFVIKNKSNSDDNSLGKRSENFLTSWSFITSRILEELTLKSASTFGSFQLIIMMFEEYILLVIENQMISRLDADLKCAVTQHLRKPDLRRPENVARICNSIGIGRTTQHEPQEQQDQPEQQQKQEQQLQQQQQQLVLPSVQEQMQQYHTLQLPVAYAMESAQSNFEPQDRSFGQVGHTETINQHRTNALLMSTHAGDFQTGSQYQGLNGASVQYCNDVSIGGTVRQVLSNMPTQTIVCEELDTRVKDTFSQRASFGNTRTLPEANREFGYVSCWRNNYFSGFARSYGQEGNYVTARQQDPIQDPCQVYNQSQGHDQGQGQGHDQGQGYDRSQGHDQNQGHNQIFQPGQYQSQSYATPHELVQHQGVELDKSQFQGQPQDKGHFQSQGQQPGQSQLDVRGHLQRQGQVRFRGQIQNLQGNNFVSQSNLVHGNVCNGNLSGDSERLETNNVKQRSQSNGGYAVSFCSNTSSTEKTVLPSFYQLSTQLAANSRLQSRY